MTRFRLSSGSVEALKWLALVAMTGDHIDAFVFGRSVPVLEAIGRLAMPLFALVLAYNLARPGIDLTKPLVKLLAFGVLAWWPHAHLTGAAVPLNILFSFAVAVGVLAAWTTSKPLAAVVFVVGGAVVEYGWPGVGLVLAGVWWFRTGRVEAYAAVLLAVGGVSLYGSAWAFVAIPVIWLASLEAPALARSPWAFWVYYPGHLAALAVLLA